MNDALNKATITRHEGRRLVAYKDSRGFLTIFIGFNLDAAGARLVCDRAGLDYESVRAGAVMTDAECDAVFQIQYGAVAAQARLVFPDVDNYPENVGAVVCDMLFELGFEEFLKFRHLIAAIGTEDWPHAAAMLAAETTLAREVPNRVADNVKLLEAAAVPA